MSQQRKRKSDSEPQTTRVRRVRAEGEKKKSVGNLPEAIKQYLLRVYRRIKMVKREHSDKNFPESNRILVQLVLFLAAMVALRTSLLREKLTELRRRVIHRTGKRGPIGRRAKATHRALFVCGALVIAAGAIMFSRYTVGTVVTYEGKVLETVESTRVAKRVTEKVESITTETTGKMFAFADSAIQYTSCIVERSDISDRSVLESELTEEVGLVTYGYSLYIDEELVGSTQYAGALESLLNQLKENYQSADTLTINFVEDVRIAEGYVPTDSIVNLGYIAELLNSTKSGEVTYTVQRGDTWGKIAMDNGMSNDDLSKLNPGFDINKLQIGDELMIANAVPYLTVVVTERQNYVDDVQYGIDYVDDNTMYQGDYRVISKGAFGTADVVADVTYINGIETEREVISSVMLTEPVTEHRAQGTIPRPSWYPTGSFRWPTSGRITSYFGYRNTGIRGASTYHQGIDIAVSYGTPIYAADGGTVIYSGYKGAMGNVVIIQHNGTAFTTYYEHNSRLLVRAGDKVYKGQKIALAGSSGVSSGTHCHFGIQRNGVYVNPLNYLP